MRMFGTGQRNHRVTVRKWREVLLQFVRRPAGGDEMNFVEIEAAVRGAPNSKMAVVNWVERASKQRDAARMMPCCGAALRLRGGQ